MASSGVSRPLMLMLLKLPSSCQLHLHPRGCQDPRVSPQSPGVAISLVKKNPAHGGGGHLTARLLGGFVRAETEPLITGSLSHPGAGAMTQPRDNRSAQEEVRI